MDEPESIPFPIKFTIINNMKKPYIITIKELETFINSQRNDRQVHPMSGHHSDRVGCVLVQYARSKGWKFHSCSFGEIYETGHGFVGSFGEIYETGHGFVAMIEDDKALHDCFRSKRGANHGITLWNIRNYGELKKKLKTGLCY